MQLLAWSTDKINLVGILALGKSFTKKVPEVERSFLLVQESFVVAWGIWDTEQLMVYITTLYFE